MSSIDEFKLMIGSRMNSMLGCFFFFTFRVMVSLFIQLTWVANVKENLNSGEAARDVATAENLLKNHQDLCDDIRTHHDE